MIEQHLKNIEKELELIRQNLKIEIQAEYIGNDTFKISWAPREGKGDILYGIGSFEHSYKDYVDEIDLLQGSVEIEVGKKGLWQFKLVGDVESKPVEASNVEQEEDTSETNLFGWWDYKVGLGGTVGKSRSKSIGYIIDQGIPAIAIIEGFSEDKNEIRERLKDSAPFIQKYEPITQNLFTILTDEPFSEEKDAAIMEYMVSEAKKVIGNEYEFSFTFKEKAFMDDRALPQNLDWAGINLYPFRAANDVRTKQQFFSYAEAVLSRAKQKLPDSTKIFIVWQAFYGTKWVQPPDDAPLWYAEFARKHGIEVNLYWKYQSSSEWKGVEDMTGFFESLRKID